MELAGVKVMTNAKIDRARIEREKPDAVIVATGARPRRPHFEGEEEMHVFDVWQVLKGEANVGSSVVVAVFRSDWVGMGFAAKLAPSGSRVRLAVKGYLPVQRNQQNVTYTLSAVMSKTTIQTL